MPLLPLRMVHKAVELWYIYGNSAALIIWCCPCIVRRSSREVYCMAKRKISLIGLVVVMICVLVFAPVVTAGIYFIHTVSGQLQHTASETVSMYLNEFTDRTDRMMETLRDGVYYLTSDRAAQQMMSSSKPLTQIQILRHGAEFQPHILARRFAQPRCGQRHLPDQKRPICAGLRRQLLFEYLVARPGRCTRRTRTATPHARCTRTTPSLDTHI